MPANVIQAHQILSDLYSHAHQALRSDSETHRLQFHSEAIVNDAFPMILAFECGEDEYPALTPWIHTTAEIFIELLKEISMAEGHPKGPYVNHFQH